MQEPGEAGRETFRIISISLKPLEDDKLTKLKRHLEDKEGKRLSTTEVARRAFDCLFEAEGVK